METGVAGERGWVVPPPRLALWTPLAEVAETEVLGAVIPRVGGEVVAKTVLDEASEGRLMVNGGAG